MPRILIDAARVKQLTGLSDRALRYRRQQGLEPISFKLGKSVVYDEDDVLAWVEKERAKGIQRVQTDEAPEVDQVEAWVQRQLRAAPELTAEQRDLIRRLLRPQQRDPSVA